MASSLDALFIIAADGTNLAQKVAATLRGDHHRVHAVSRMIFHRKNMLVTSRSGRCSTRGRTGTARAVGRLTLMTIAGLAIAIGSGPANAENPDISSRRAAERTDFTNDEIKDGFFKIAFHAEFQLDKPAERVRRFDEPVAITDNREDANFVVMLVEKHNLIPTIRSRYGADRAKQIQRSLHPQCLSGIGKDELYRIRRAEVILPIDAGEFTFYDCAYEELLQALGAINDDQSVPWTMFNDDVQMGFFDVYDQYLLNILYDPRIRPGMSKEEVGAILPEVLSTARAWVNNAKSHRADALHRPTDATKYSGAVTSDGPLDYPQDRMR
jgi:hypothetical protein